MLGYWWRWKVTPKPGWVFRRDVGRDTYLPQKLEHLPTNVYGMLSLGTEETLGWILLNIYDNIYIAKSL